MVLFNKRRNFLELKIHSYFWSCSFYFPWCMNYWILEPKWSGQSGPETILQLTLRNKRRKAMMQLTRQAEMDRSIWSTYITFKEIEYLETPANVNGTTMSPCRANIQRIGRLNMTYMWQMINRSPKIYHHKVWKKNSKNQKFMRSDTLTCSEIDRLGI